MVCDYSNLLAKAQHWATETRHLGWLPASIAQQFSEETAVPNWSVNAQDTRPLLVAFMGGTGVGKSSLLNRLAGKAIAKAGIERPTSREVTLFHHASVDLQHLPLSKINCAQHHDDTKKHIVWIDMPDFDSTEQSNKQLVLSWLPYIDVLIYVVSPERYRDEKSWRLLLAEGAKHAWLFAFNQWDRGQLVQYNDFEQQLHKAGFSSPLIFKTVCADERVEDEFAALATMLQTLANSHTVEQLEQRGVQVRKNALKAQLQAMQPLLGTLNEQKLNAIWQTQWQQTVSILQQGLAWPLQQLANYYAEHATDLLTLNASPNLTTALWNDWAQGHLDDALNNFIQLTHQAGLPSTPFKQQLIQSRERAAQTTRSQVELAVSLALAKPGNALQRGFLKVMRVCEIGLPVAAMAWVSYRVFIGYYTSNMHEVAYLGVDFAMHSSLLIALTWLLPFFIVKKAQPSLQKSALRGANNGLQNALDTINNDVVSAISTLHRQHDAQSKQLDELIELCATQQTTSIDDNSPLTRMLLN